MRKTLNLTLLGLVLLTAGLQGCETLRGAKKDVDNTAEHIKKLPQYDKWIQENAW